MAPRRGMMRRGPGAPTEKAENFKGTLRELLKYMGVYKIALLFVMIFAVGSTVFTVVGPKILGNATTELFHGLMAKISGTGSIDFDKIGKILLGLIILYIVSALFGLIQGWLMTGISQKMCRKMRRDISEKINRMPLGYFESHLVGDVLSRITNDVDTMGQSLNQSVTQLITSLCTVIGVIVMMLTISPLMTLISLIILPVSMLLIMLVVKKSQKYFKAQQKYLGEIDGQIEETFSGHQVVKAFNREQTELENFKKTNDILYESAWKSQFLSGLMMPVMNFVSNLGYVAVAIVGAMLAANGTIEIGGIVSFVQYVKRFTQPITQLAQVSNMLQSMAASAERIFEFLNEEEEQQTVENPASPDCINGQVSFEHVQFGYKPDHLVIHDFNCDVKPGQMVAIVGPTGAGKTTMVNLLMRFYEISGGSISIDGIDTTSVPRWNVHDQFSMVLQDTWVFRGTVRENIAYSKPGVTDEQIVSACKAVGLDHFVRSLPRGYDTVLDDNTSLSQGQRQLLTIARAMVQDAPILILDEATSSVDTRTEELIQKAMDALTVGRTSFVIAHRLSTIRDADLILVMREGDIVEQGTHDELIEAGGFYADLYNSQFEDVTA